MYVLGSEVNILELCGFEIISWHFFLPLIYFLVTDKANIKLHVDLLWSLFVIFIFDNETMRKSSEEIVERQGTKMTVFLPDTNYSKTFAEENCGIGYEFIFAEGSPLDIAFGQVESSFSFGVV